MNSKIQINYHLVYIFIISLLLGYCMFSLQQVNNALKLKVIIIRDSIAPQSSSMLPLNETNLKKALKDNNIHHSKIVLAQAKLETGNFTSRVCKTHNNLFGLRKKDGSYYKFNHWKQSVTAYKKYIQNRYNNDINYYSFLRNIGYAEDKAYIDKLKRIESQI